LVSEHDALAFCRPGVPAIEIEGGSRSFVVRDDFLLDINGCSLLKYFGRDSTIVYPQAQTLHRPTTP
jgi:hypothetical protein